MKQNEGKIDRILRVIIGITLLIISSIYLSGVVQVIGFVFGLVMLITGLIGFCALYKLFNFSTKKSLK